MNYHWRSHILIDKPSQEEAKNYVLTKELNKPRISIFVPIILGISILALPAILSSILIWCVHVKMQPFLLFLLMYLFFFFGLIRPLLISVVLIYQKKAPEVLRRSCMCKPTCSEYAIKVLLKYPIIVAIIKIIIRLKKTCTGKLYKIDMP